MRPIPLRISTVHAAGFLVTSILWVLILARIDRRILEQCLIQSDFLLLSLSFLLFGMVLFCGALRWHSALRSIDQAIHFGATSRLLLIGHAFSVFPSGFREKNAVRASLYALWFRRDPKQLRGIGMRWSGWLPLELLLLCAVIALILLAVSPGALPWPHMAWVLPVLSLLTFVPFTVAGGGAREVASVYLLGMWGLYPEIAIAASLWVWLVVVAWAGLGSFIYRRESVRQRLNFTYHFPKSISVVIPTLNEAANLPETLRRLELIPQITEIIAVDGGSKDETVRVAQVFGCRVLHGAAGRGSQLRLGAQQARGDVIMMLHADSWLAPNAGQAVLDTLRDNTVVAGGLWKRFRQPPWLLLGSRFRCGVRLFLWRRIAGDQALFVRRETLEQIGGVPDVALMEEFILCERLRRLGRLALADAVVDTSARRFRKHGILRTYLLMGRIHALYKLGKSPEELRRLYENH